MISDKVIDKYSYKLALIFEVEDEIKEIIFIAKELERMVSIY